MNHWIKESMNQWFNESINQCIREPRHKWINESMTRRFSESMNQINQQNQQINDPVNQPINESRNQWINEFSQPYPPKVLRSIQFLAILKCIELSLQSRAHFADLIFQKRFDPLSFWRCKRDKIERHDGQDEWMDEMDRRNGWADWWMDGWIAGLMGGWIGTYGRF